MSNRSIIRAVRYLEEHGHIVTVKIGTANCYVINAKEVFHNLDKYQNYVAINAKALGKKDNTLRKRLTHLIQRQQELPLGEPVGRPQRPKTGDG